MSSCASSKPCHKELLVLERPQVTRVERIGPVLFRAACGFVAANHSSDFSRRGLLTIWRTSRSSPIQNWRDEVTCIKSEKSSRIYTPLQIPYASVDITTKPIVAAVGEGRDEKCEVVGQDPFASPTGCRLNTVVRVYEVVWQATATLRS